MVINVAFEKPSYNFSQLKNRKSIGYTQSLINTNFIIIDNARNNDISSHLLERLLFRLENVEENFVVILTGDNVLNKNDTAKGQFFIDDIGKGRSSILSERYSEKFKTPVLQFSDVFYNADIFATISYNVLNNLTINDCISNTILSEYVTVQDSMRVMLQNLLETNSPQINGNTKIIHALNHLELDTEEIFKSNYTFITTNNENIPVSIREGHYNDMLHYFERELSNTNETYYDIDYHVRYITLTRLREDSENGIHDIMVLNNHIFNSKGENLNCLPETFIDNNIPNYSVSYNYVINSFASQLIFNELNTMLTKDELCDTRSAVYFLNSGESYKIFDIEVPKIHFENFYNIFKVKDHSTDELIISIDEELAIKKKLNEIYAENWEFIHTRTLKLLKDIVNLTLPIETMNGITSSIVRNDDSNNPKPYKKEFYQKLIHDTLRGLFISKSSLIDIYDNIDISHKVVIKKMLANAVYSLKGLSTDITNEDFNTITPYQRDLMLFDTDDITAFERDKYVNNNIITEIYYTLAMVNALEVWE